MTQVTNLDNFEPYWFNGAPFKVVIDEEQQALTVDLVRFDRTTHKWNREQEIFRAGVVTTDPSFDEFDGLSKYEILQKLEKEDKLNYQNHGENERTFNDLNFLELFFGISASPVECSKYSDNFLKVEMRGDYIRVSNIDEKLAKKHLRVYGMYVSKGALVLDIEQI